jgi:hypothetical protein
MNDEQLLQAVLEIRNWIRAASHSSVKTLLETALSTDKARTAYQMSDGKNSVAEIRRVSKMSPNDVIALQGRCVALGLMEITRGNRRSRLFDLQDFGLVGDKR